MTSPNRQARWPGALGALTAAALLASPAAHALRCDGRVISEGDPKTRVRAFCGEPASVEHRAGLRRLPSLRHLDGRVVRGAGHLVERITIETWTYNFGPRRLMRELRFENGRLRRIERLGYGHRE